MVSADVSVRVAWPADAAAIADIQARTWRQQYDEATLAVLDDAEGQGALADAWRASLSRPPEARHRVMVALVHDHVVGFALTVPTADPDADPARDGEVREFTVDPDKTRAGHGSRLLQACADTLEADRFARAVCWIGSTDDELRAFLTGAGWAADGASRELADDAGHTIKQVRLHTSLA